MAKIPLVDNLPNLRDDIFANVSVLDTIEHQVAVAVDADDNDDEDGDTVPFIRSTQPQPTFVNLDPTSSEA